MPFSSSLEQTGLATWVREAPTLWAWPFVLTLHTFGLAFAVGTSAAIALRILGVAKDLPLPPIGRFFRAKFIAATSLFLWIGVMFFGRMLPYLAE